jgi:arylsulfatase
MGESVKFDHLVGRLALPLTLLAVPASGATRLDRTVLPIPEPEPAPITELDARDAKPPPRFEVTAPEGAPNVLVVLIDDLGFA